MSDPRIDTQRWEIVRTDGEDDSWGIRAEGEDRGQSVAQMMWKWDAEHIVELHNQWILSSTGQNLTQKENQQP